MVARQSRARFSGMYSTSMPSSAFRHPSALQLRGGAQTPDMRYGATASAGAFELRYISPSGCPDRQSLASFARRAVSVRPRHGFEKHNSTTETSALTPEVSCSDFRENEIQHRWSCVIKGSACRVCKSRTRTVCYGLRMTRKRQSVPCTAS
ncbi:hypothetical protein BD311DRAFT_768756 [Dichomitus squalens]|uniref:Uncharacterized protein n=1 Tax=Dichomitus squalens TaxID=114155 RepID=A0A4Q9MBH5_9APHY|nr:hypothetical protein BD311DRAFT_768756 [Dichomitus squalens]